MASCRLLPHGGYSLIPATITTMAWLASLFQDGCDFSRLSGDIVPVVADDPDAPWLEVGFRAYRAPTFNSNTNTWEVTYSSTCLVYPDSIKQDGIWLTSKAFDFLALVLGGGGTFFLWFSTCCVFSRATWRWAGYEVMLASVFQALSFLWFRTSVCQDSANHCSLFWGSKADIIAAAFWATAATLIFCRYPVPKNSDGDGLMVSENIDQHISQAPVQVNEGDLSLTEIGAEGSSPRLEERKQNDERQGQQLQQASGEDPRQEGDQNSMTVVEIV